MSNPTVTADSSAAAAAGRAPRLLENLWNDADAAKLEANSLDLLRYRSNRLGDDLRITNFGGGNTSSKFDLIDPLTGQPQRVMAVKGSGGDLRSITNSGFAILYLDKLNSLIARYRGEALEDEMVGFYPLCAFGENRVAASIDTPLHAFLPFDHVDHLHPDWAIALAASANGERKMQEFNRKYGRKIIWVPWQRPGFELALMLKRAVEATPGCDGLILGGHGLFTWGHTQKECYLNSIRTIDEMGEFIQEHTARKGEALFGGPAVTATVADRQAVVAEILPYLRGVVSSNRRVIAHVDGSDDALTFANSRWAEDLCQMGTSCPDHFLRTRISPMFIPWDPAKDDVEQLGKRIGERAEKYRKSYAEYYSACADKSSPKLRDSNPSVVVVPGLGLFGFGKDKREARITSEFFVNAIHVMAGANALEDDCESRGPAAAGANVRSRRATSSRSTTTSRFRAPKRSASNTGRSKKPSCSGCRQRRSSAARWSSCSARAAASVARSRSKSPSVAGTWSSADANVAGAEEAKADAARLSSNEMVMSAAMDLTSRDSMAAGLRAAVLQFGGFDCIVNTAALFPTPDPSVPVENVWGRTLQINLTSNFVLAQEAAKVMKAQNLPASIVLTSSANAVVPKSGSEPYDVSKSAINHLIRELAIGLGPLIRVNGIAPATVIAGSSMFPRDRVIVSLKKYSIDYDDSESTEDLRTKLAEFYARRTITKRPILPIDNANAICWLAGDQSAKTTGHVIPVDGGLPEAFLR